MKTLLQNIKLTHTYMGYNVDKNMANMNNYKCKLTYNKKSMTFQYSIGKALTENDITIENCLYSLLLDASSNQFTFTEFSDNFGYDSDSIKAHNIYKACIKTANQLNRLFNADELNQLRLYTENM